ncbi:MAG: hypothetical protein ACKVRN_15800 [Pyrinomonadaceae bacterium]
MIAAALVFLAHIYRYPGSSVSVFLFMRIYQLVDDKHGFLYAYSPARRDGNYLPREVDDFLCEQAENTLDENELDAIVNLYILQAGGNRDGHCIFKTSDATRQKIAEIIVGNLDQEDDLKLVYKSIVLLEEVRRGKSLDKGYLNTSSSGLSTLTTPEERRHWLDETGLPTAAEAYIKWWRSPNTWDQKKATDPLSGTAAQFTGCCP